MLLLLGFVCLVWSSIAWPSFWLTGPVRDVAARISAGERFKPGVLPDWQVRMNAAPRGAVLQADFSQADALIALRVAEEGLRRKNSEEADRETGSAEVKVRTALSFSPNNSFLWLMAYSLEMSRSGFQAKSLKYLDQSYATGPREGWIALRRNRMALAVFPELEHLTQANVVLEFSNIVDSGFVEEAAANMKGVGWDQRERLLVSLGRVDIAAREAFAKVLARASVNVSVPGVASDERWFR
ncbi:hypothetical protein GPL17_22865 [Bradyrhizobium yuanmingense]|uniref:hypothetical protein n=1 Tax=Bradyrhizobium yuanmingense TaxID=108015 RepID=UPI0012F88E12|nr:hypothetical protein [Bradyrhizobium yuanmingense]MVT53317.1 hypothetical protein [Bradyrhizobium yuanmingense]